jgi:hypothetical protein
MTISRQQVNCGDSLRDQAGVGWAYHNTRIPLAGIMQDRSKNKLGGSADRARFPQ